MAQTSTISFGPPFQPRTAPVTFWFLVASVGFWLLAFLMPGLAQVGGLLAFGGERWLTQPWSLVTYPLVNLHGSPFTVLLMGYVMWWSGAEIERWWGSRIHLLFLLVVSAATALLLALGGMLLAVSAGAAGAGIPLCAVLTVWALRNLRTPVILLIVPANGAVLLVLEVLSLWMGYGPALGLFAVAGGCGLPAAYFYWGHRLHALFRPSAPRSGPDRRAVKAAARAESERRRREQRVAEIFERSGLHAVDDDRGKPRS